MSDNEKGYYNSERKGFETKDGGLIRINGDEKVRIDIYEGNEREKGGHTRDTINIDTNTGKGSIDQHNADKFEKSSIDIIFFLTTACMRHYYSNFNDNCYELKILRWFREKFVTEDDIKHYYEIAPIIVEAINNEKENETIYSYIYHNVIQYCITQIENKNFEEAYFRYKNCILDFEEKIARPFLEKKLVKVLKLSR